MALALNCERGDTAWAHVGVRVLYRDLDILRVIILAANDDQVLQHARDEEHAVLEVALVARAQEGLVEPGRAAGARSRRARTRRLGELGSAHVAARDRRRGDPDLARLALAFLDLRLRVDDAQIDLCRGSAMMLRRVT